VVIKAILLAPLLIALAAGPVLAKPTVIAELGTAPLLGTSVSTAQMRARVAHNEGILSAAAARLGLSAGEYAQFHAAIDDSRVAWVTMPRHLDAMTWQGGGRVYALHDVVIPANTHGWEVDLRSRGQILALYMPAKCGNLSLVRKAAPAIAHHAVVPVYVAAVPPVVAPPPVVVAAAPAPPPPDDTPPAAPVVAAAPSAFPPAAAARHIPLFLAPLLFGLAALSGGLGSGPVVAPPVGCP
jgi:hypothetical protein